jgi:WD40 repeat protein/tetratricopeptide (TPR) repeat protein
MLVLISALAALPMSVLRSEWRLLAQTPAEPTPTFIQPETVAPTTTVTIDGSPAMAGINQSLKQGFEARYPGTRVVLSTSSDGQALQALRSGTIDLAALGRTLQENELDPSLTSIPVTREKIAIIVGRDNPFQGDLSFENFAAIFRGDITNWSQVGGPNRPLRFIDRPADSNTRLALVDYEIFRAQPLSTGANTVTLDTDDTAAVVRELGNDGISYAIASEVIGQDAVRPLSMDNTLPDDPRYPYSQPVNYIYRGEPSLPVAAFLGFATNAEGQAAVEQAQRAASDDVTVGSARLPGGVALAPNGQFMVRGTEDGQLQWLDAAGNPTNPTVVNAHRGAVSAVVLSPDGQTVVSSGADGTLRRWDRNGNPLGEPLVGIGGPILAMAVSPDGQTLASGNADGTVERWALADGAALGEPLAAHTGPVQALHFPAGGQFLISGGSDGSLGFWNPDGTAVGQTTNAQEGGVTAITSSPDGQVITTTGGDGTFRQWDRSTLQPRGETVQAHGNAISAVAYSPDGNTLATAGTDSTLQLWGPDGAPRLAEAVQLVAPAASLGFTPEGQLVVARSDRQVELRDSQGAPMTVVTDATEPDTATATDADPDSAILFWDRLRNLPPRAWWMLAAIPLLLLLAGLAGALLGSRGRNDDDEDDDELALAPEAEMDVAGLGQLPVPVDVPPHGVVVLPEAGDGPSTGVGLPPEAGLVPLAVDGDGAADKLEQARKDLVEGRRLMRESQYDTALNYFDSAVEATEVARVKAETTGIPAQGITAIAAQAQAQRGNALAMLGQADEAMDSYNTALQIDASTTEAWIGKGQLVSTLGRYEEAIFCFDSALELDPSAAAAWLGKGHALMQLGRQAEAQASLAQAEQLGLRDPNGPEAGNVGFSSGGWLGAAIAPGLGDFEEAPSVDNGSGYGVGYGSGGYDPDVPLDLQQMVQGLPSADVEIAGATVVNPYDVPPDLVAEVAQLPDQPENVGMAAGQGLPSEGLEVTPGLNPPQEMGPLITDDMSLEEELLRQVHLSLPTDLVAPAAGEIASWPPAAPDTTLETAAQTVPPLRPAPTPVPAPVPLEPGDYIPPPSLEVGASEEGDLGTEDLGGEDLAAGLEGLPPEVMAALASIPPSSPDSFGVLPTPDSGEAVTPAAAPSSWVRLSVDHEGGRFYAVWQIDEGDRTRAQEQGGEILALRLYDVTGRGTAAPLPAAVAEQLCRDDFAQDWYLPIPQWDRIYVVEVGYLSGADDWQAIAESAEVAAITPT